MRDIALFVSETPERPTLSALPRGVCVLVVAVLVWLLDVGGAICDMRYAVYGVSGGEWLGRTPDGRTDE